MVTSASASPRQLSTKTPPTCMCTQTRFQHTQAKKCLVVMMQIRAAETCVAPSCTPNSSAAKTVTLFAYARGGLLWPNTLQTCRHTPSLTHGSSSHVCSVCTTLCATHAPASLTRWPCPLRQQWSGPVAQKRPGSPSWQPWHCRDTPTHGQIGRQAGRQGTQLLSSSGVQTSKSHNRHEKHGLKGGQLATMVCTAHADHTHAAGANSLRCQPGEGSTITQARTVHTVVVSWASKTPCMAAAALAVSVCFLSQVTATRTILLRTCGRSPAVRTRCTARC